MSTPSTPSESKLIARCLRELLRWHQDPSCSGRSYTQFLRERAEELEAAGPAQPQYRALEPGELVQAGDEGRRIPASRPEWYALELPQPAQQMRSNYEYRTTRQPAACAPEGLSEEDLAWAMAKLHETCDACGWTMDGNWASRIRTAIEEAIARGRKGALNAPK